MQENRTHKQWGMKEASRVAVGRITGDHAKQAIHHDVEMLSDEKMHRGQSRLTKTFRKSCSNTLQQPTKALQPWYRQSENFPTYLPTSRKGFAMW